GCTGEYTGTGRIHVHGFSIMSQKKKIRVDLRKNRTKPPREKGWTREFHDHQFDEKATTGEERVRAKGDLSRRRTIISDAPSGRAPANSAPMVMPAVDTQECLSGRVVRVHGLQSVVETEDGRPFRCAVRRLLKSLVTDERNVVTTGDRVWFRPSGNDE